jgi:hypothetical protein
MAKIILNDGSEEFLSPGAARAKVAAGEAVFAQPVPTYSTRQVVAEKPKAEKPKEKAKPKRKRRTKAQIEAEAAADEAE